MTALFDLFLDICLLRKGPQDVPSSAMLLKLVVFCYAVLGFLTLTLGLAELDVLMALWLTLVHIGLLLGLTYALLHWLRFGNRFVQTATTLAGADTLFSVVGLPLWIWFRTATENGADTLIPQMLIFTLFIWSVVVTAHVLQHALSITRWGGAAYAIGYVLASGFVSYSLSPP